MQIFEKFKEHAARALNISSNSESGNEELVRYYQTILHDLGFKTQLQEVKHAIDSLSKRQYNLIAFTSDTLVDRTTRKGVLFINPLDTSSGTIPMKVGVDEGGLHGPGSVQGKIDFLCRVYAALDLLDHRHKNPLYIVGTAASHFGMLGSRFLIESLLVNPKEVYTFSPTELKKCKKSPGHLSFGIDIDSPARNRDSRGYNRCVQIAARGVSLDFSTPKDAVNAFDMLIDLLLSGAQSGFDFQWNHIEARGAECANPDFATVKIFLTAFQFEDFKQFLKEKLQPETYAQNFVIDFVGVSEGGTSFFPTELIEVILELDHEWKRLIEGLNQFPNDDFAYEYSSGAMTRVFPKNSGKFHVSFELRFLPQHQQAEIQNHWKQIVKGVFEKHSLFHYLMVMNCQVQGVDEIDPMKTKNVNYSSDAGFFHKGKFPVTLIGAGSTRQCPKGPEEHVRWAELEKAIQIYRELMLKVSG
ncbi:MAG: M20/M25/M40 family metallo-hydrolase [Bdellovibrionales bacterium]|nr:M20/M25/M40 family metallo-hydrolase [Bdellovibrionales bacterium]